MKKCFLHILLVGVLGMLAVSCSDEYDSMGLDSRQAQVVFSVAMDTPVSRSRVAEDKNTWGSDDLKNLKMKAARAAKDLSQEELAQAVGVTRQTIGMIEAGKYNPTLNLCIAICKALDKTLDELFWEEDEK